MDQSVFGIGTLPPTRYYQWNPQFNPSLAKVHNFTDTPQTKFNPGWGIFGNDARNISYSESTKQPFGWDSTPPNRIAQLEADYKAGKIPFSQLFEQYNLPSRYPAVSNTTTGAFSDVGAVDKAVGLPDFNALKKDFGGANADMNQWYNRYQAGNDISGFAAGQRALDAGASNLTGQYAGIARGQLGDAAGVIDRYRTQGLGALDKYTANASDFYNKDIPASIANALKEATGYTSRYAMGRGGGMGSDVATIAGAAAVRAALPFQLQGRQYMGDALSRYQPFYGDVAARDYSRIAGLNVPVEQNIYGAQQGDVLRSKATEQQIQNLDLLVKDRGLNAAIANLKNQGLSQSVINSLVAEWQSQKARTLGLAGQAAGLEQQFGGERGYNYMPGANVQDPQYYGLPQPNYPNNNPGRYPTQNPQQGNPQAGPGGIPSIAGVGPVPMSQQDQNIARALAYSKQHPAANPYGGQYPNAGSGNYNMGEPQNGYWPDVSG